MRKSKEKNRKRKRRTVLRPTQGIKKEGEVRILFKELGKKTQKLRD